MRPDRIVVGADNEQAMRDAPSRSLLSDLFAAGATVSANDPVAMQVDRAETFLHRITDFTLFRVMPGAETLATGIVDFSSSPAIEWLGRTIMLHGCIMHPFMHQL